MKVPFEISPDTSGFIDQSMKTPSNSFHATDLDLLYVFSGHSRKATLLWNAICFLISLCSVIREMILFNAMNKFWIMFGFLSHLSAIMTFFMLFVGVWYLFGV